MIDGSVRLAEDRQGIVVNGHAIEGFPYLEGLSPAEQTRVARWAQQLAPEALTVEQRELLDALPTRQPSVRRRVGQRHDEVLGSPLVRGLWQLLDDDERALVLDPDRKLDKRYPLSTGDLHRLTGATTRQIQYWSTRRILPHSVDAYGHRSFEAAGVIVAFALLRSTQHDRQHYATIVMSRRPLAAMRTAIGVTSLAVLTAGRRSDPAELEETERVLRAMADVVREVRLHPDDASSALGI